MTADTWCGALRLTTAQTVAAGQTLTVCAGSTITAASATVSITVAGTLLVQGTAQAPVKLVGAQGGTADWAGLIVAGGGNVSATYLEIHNAKVAMSARVGSSYTIDHVLIDNSSQMLILASNGTISNGTMHGLGSNQPGTPIVIDNASPHVTNTVINQGSYGGVDMVVADGVGSAPVFDHVEVADSHCAFHFNQGNGATISNSFIHHNFYGFMVIASVAGHVLHSNFEDNAVANIGSCSGGSTEAKDNFFVGTVFDGSCATLQVTGTAPPTAYTTGVGPTP
jgi:hypothetical protein